MPPYTPGIGDRLTETVIGAAIEVHRALGPGLLESVYRDCLLVELVEAKAVELLHPLHLAQVITYLKLTGCPTGLILNFNTTSLRRGIRRVVHPDRYIPRRELDETVVPAAPESSDQQTP